jgi:hypothetical protein
MLQTFPEELFPGILPVLLLVLMHLTFSFLIVDTLRGVLEALFFLLLLVSV